MNPPPLPVQKRFPWILYWLVLVLIFVVAFAPVGSVVACGLIANAHGCRVDEGSVHPCVINGKDCSKSTPSSPASLWIGL
jgi:hypothetical protein